MGYRSYTASYLFVDREGNEARTQVSLPTSLFSFQQADAYFATMYGAFQLVSDATITEYKVSKSYRLAEGDEPANGSDVTRTGVFVVSLAGDNYALVLLPSLRLDTIVRMPDSGADIVVDGSLPSVAGFGTFLTGLTDEYNTPITGIVIAGVSY